MSAVLYTCHTTPLGEMLLIGDDDRLLRSTLPGTQWPIRLDEFHRDHPEISLQQGTLRRFTRALDRYFAGDDIPGDLPLDLTAPPFRSAAWTAMRTVPRGQVISYGELALRAGRPGAARAAGTACGANPLPIFVPCHRIVAAGGGLGGFGGGLDLKRELLAMEGVTL